MSAMTERLIRKPELVWKTESGLSELSWVAWMIGAPTSLLVLILLIRP